ncbi:peptidase S8/S53 domain-containing protein [Bombardia bombarda]|uniref:Peptidase S8/S53 domain-containing protein n=1 Tax=Bombardia bombarda TaxID=252184 RepID=A0AA40CGV8_9PEZI|nr:peptidase S8/S53 domain-containing protein [Bombardia bombarda]
MTSTSRQMKGLVPCPSYLSLISAPKNHEKPGQGDSYRCHPSKGKGIWIVIPDTGFQLNRYPHEWKSDQRTIKTWIVPPSQLHVPWFLRNDEWVCDNSMDDNAKARDEEGMNPEGHGTSIAIIAAGSQSGVAPLANLYLQKVQTTAFRKIPGKPRWWQWCIPLAYVTALENIIEVVDRGEIPPGKAVVSIQIGFDLTNIYDEFKPTFDEYKERCKRVLEAFSKRGIVVVMAAGNSCAMLRETTESKAPTCLAGPRNDAILVGGTDMVGRLWWESTPGTKDCPVDIYAPACQVECYDLTSTSETPSKKWGTSYSSPQVAGLAAYFLGHPDFQERFKYSPSDYKNGNTVGMRMKKWLKEISFQRVPDEEKLVLEHAEDYYHPDGIPPTTVNVLSNNY